MVFDVIIGRSKSEREKYGKEGTLFIGKQYIEMGQSTSLSNPVYIDVAKSHIVFVVGKRGSGKSYTMSMIAEGLADLPLEVKQNLSIILLDTMGIFWTMKYPNYQDAELLNQWGILPKGLDVKIFTPAGFYNKYKDEGIPTDFPFSIQPKDVEPEDWCKIFSIDKNSAEGVLIFRAVQDANKLENFTLDTLINIAKKDKESEITTKHIIINQLEKAKEWGIFSDQGTPLKDLIFPGQVTILDMSPYATMASGWDIKALVVGLISNRLFKQRMLSRKTEEFRAVDTSMHYFSKSEEDKITEPLVWLALDECLPYSSSIITNKGKMKIGKVINQWTPKSKFTIQGYDLERKKFSWFPITKVYKKGIKELIELKTETNKKIICTPDHKILTKDGFLEAQKATNIGVPLETAYSKERKHIIARLLGHLYGDGWLSGEAKKKDRQVGFSGKVDKGDLNKIKEDLELLGFSSGKIYSRETISTIKQSNGQIISVKGMSHSITGSSRIFDLFLKLGAPVGKKTNQVVLIPEWLMKASKQEKAEFLAALFGSDGMAPSQSNKWGGDFNPIRLSFNKVETLRLFGENYAQQLNKLFADLGIKLSSIVERKNGGNIRKDGTKSIKIQLTLAKSVENTIKFLEQVGFRYCTKKEVSGLKWLYYLKARNYSLKEREKLRAKVFQIRHKKGWGKVKIAKALGIPDYQVREWLYFKRRVKLSWSFHSFKIWTDERCKENILYENIITNKKKKPKPVYDISVDKVHNFIADGFVVHNCHELLPREGKTIATDALLTILREGRQPGISLILASQQPGKIHTDVMTQSDIVIAHRLTSKLDVDALGDLMQSYMRRGLDEELNILPEVKGAALIFDDTNERIFPVQLRPKFTWHGGGSPSALKEKKNFFNEAMERLKEL